MTPKGETLSHFLLIGGFLLKLPENCMFSTNLGGKGAQGDQGLPGSATVQFCFPLIDTLYNWLMSFETCALWSKLIKHPNRKDLSFFQWINEPVLHSEQETHETLANCRSEVFFPEISIFDPRVEEVPTAPTLSLMCSVV